MRPTHVKVFIVERHVRDLHHDRPHLEPCCTLHACRSLVVGDVVIAAQVLFGCVICLPPDPLDAA